jgi:hypothetical protein
MGHYPGAVESCMAWGRHGDCAPEVDHSTPPRNYDWLSPGKETLTYKAESCAPGGSVEL